jgi:hypothetical protein
MLNQADVSIARFRQVVSELIETAQDKGQKIAVSFPNLKTKQFNSKSVALEDPELVAMVNEWMRLRPARAARVVGGGGGGGRGGGG